MDKQYERTEILVGEEGIRRLKQSHIAVFGIGGVGGFAAESLVRSGVGEISFIDGDIISLSNLNRQVIAAQDTVGLEKTEVMKKRCLSINPDLSVHTHYVFFLPENANRFDFCRYDYIIDAVDTVTAKLELIMRAKGAGVPLISCMGAGNKLDSGQFKLADIYDTKICPLAKVMRRECKKRGVESLRVLYSEEQPLVRGEIPGSTAFAPAVAGLMIAEYVFREIIQKKV